MLVSTCVPEPRSIEKKHQHSMGIKCKFRMNAEYKNTHIFVDTLELD